LVEVEGDDAAVDQVEVGPEYGRKGP